MEWERLLPVFIFSMEATGFPSISMRRNLLLSEREQRLYRDFYIVERTVGYFVNITALFKFKERVIHIFKSWKPQSCTLHEPSAPFFIFTKRGQLTLQCECVR